MGRKETETSFAGEEEKEGWRKGGRRRSRSVKLDLEDE